MRKRRILAVLLTAAVLVAQLGGCNGGEGSGSSSASDSAASVSAGTEEDSQGEDGGEEESSPESRSVSLCMSQIRWGVSVDENMMKEWVKVVEENTNTQIEMIAPANNDYEQKLNVLLAAGDYPDIIRPFRGWDTVPQFAQRGYLQPLTEYVMNDPRFEATRDQNIEMFSANDEVYGITGVGNGVTKVIWFREDMVEKYGLNVKDAMSTDEFVTELQKIDKSETVPFTFPKHIINFQLFYNAFGAYGGIHPDENGVYVDGIQSDEMKATLLWLKDLYDQGLMDSEFITNENAVMREKIFSGKAASSVDYISRYSNYSAGAQSAGTPTDFVPVYTLVGPEGHTGNLNETGSEPLVLSVNNDKVEASLDIIHWLNFTPEGNQLATLGVEGIHYDILDGELTPKEDAVAAGYAVNPSELAMDLVDVNNLGFTFPGISAENLRKQFEFMKVAFSPEYMGKQVFIPVGMSQTYDENSASYTANLYEMATKIVLGSQDIDAAYEEYEQFWKSINGPQMLEELNAAK